MNGGGVFLNKNILSKTKQGLVIGILVCSGISNVRAISTNEVTYNNNGVEESLTETIDTLYSELKNYKTGGNVTPSEMLEESSGYSKGVLINGSIKKKEATTYTPGVNNITIPKGQYLNGNQVILGDSNLKSENIKSGVEIFGIKGSIKDNSGQTLEAGNITNDDNYTYLNIPEAAIYSTSSVVKVANSELLKDGWIDLTDSCAWAESVILYPSMEYWEDHRSSYIYFNKYTHQIIGMITVNSTAEIPNQSILVTLPTLEGINNGRNSFKGAVGLAIENDSEMLITARVAGNEIISSHNHNRAFIGEIIYNINFIVM